MVREEGRGGGTQLGSELGSDQDLDPDPDPWKILWIRIRIWQNDTDPLDPDPQHCFQLPGKSAVKSHHIASEGFLRKKRKTSRCFRKMFYQKTYFS